jgi:hypothetical protein
LRRRLASIVPYGIPRLYLAWFGILSRRTLGVSFHGSCRIASQGDSTLNMVSNVSVGIGVVTLLVGLPASCHIAYEAFLGLVFCSESASRCSTSVFQRRVLWLPWAHTRKKWNLVGVASIRVAKLGVGLPASCLVASQAHVRYRWHLSRSRNDRRRDARRRFASFRREPRGSIDCKTKHNKWCLVGFLGSWILSRLRVDRRCDDRRRFVSVLSCGFPAQRIMGNGVSYAVSYKHASGVNHIWHIVHRVCRLHTHYLQHSLLLNRIEQVRHESHTHTHTHTHKILILRCHEPTYYATRPDNYPQGCFKYNYYCI